VVDSYFVITGGVVTLCDRNALPRRATTGGAALSQAMTRLLWRGDCCAPSLRRASNFRRRLTYPDIGIDSRRRATNALATPRSISKHKGPGELHTLSRELQQATRGPSGADDKAPATECCLFPCPRHVRLRSPSKI